MRGTDSRGLDGGYGNTDRGTRDAEVAESLAAEPCRRNVSLGFREVRDSFSVIRVKNVTLPNFRTFSNPSVPSVASFLPVS